MSEDRISKVEAEAGLISDEASYRKASIMGFLITVSMGLLLYSMLTSIGGNAGWFDYSNTIVNIDTSSLSRLKWAFSDFSEAPFYGGIFSSLGLLIGASLAHLLNCKNSKYAGFNISYGSNIWPWILTSQVLSLFISIYILGHLNFLASGHNWIPTFLVLVGAPQAVLLVYGPNVRNLLTGSIMGSMFTLPIAMFLSDKVLAEIGLPGGLANYLALAIAILITLQTCHLLPWIKKSDFPAVAGRRERSADEKLEDLKNPLWYTRRVLADFTDPLFYGNEIASIGVILGAMLDWTINRNHGLAGAGVFPAILLSQLIGGSVGVLLYGRKHIEKGWYPTYVPVVSVGPMAVLTFGGSMPVILFASIVGGIIGAPIADYLHKNLSKHIHPVVPCVTGMFVATTLVILTMQTLAWF